MSPTPRVAWIAAAVAVSVLFAPTLVWSLLLGGLIIGALADALAARHAPSVTRAIPRRLSRGRPVAVDISGSSPGSSSVHVAQPLSAPLSWTEEARSDGPGQGRLAGSLTADRRGHHELPPSVVRVTGPAGLGRWDHHVGDPAPLTVVPDLPTAHRLARAVRRGQVGGRSVVQVRARGMGTEFEAVREYAADDDIRQVNWRATARLGRPMSNEYRIDRDREVVALIDTGRLSAARLGDATVLDVCLDAAASLALVCDVLDDRCGVVAFDRAIHRSVRTRRGGGVRVVEAIFDLEPRPFDSDYALAFQAAGRKRRLLVLFTDLIETRAARPLIDAVRVVARHHAVMVVAPIDEASAAVAVGVGASALAARTVMDARAAVVTALRKIDVVVVEARPATLALACVRGYLGVKRTARL